MAIMNGRQVVVLLLTLCAIFAGLSFLGTHDEVRLSNSVNMRAQPDGEGENALRRILLVMWVSSNEAERMLAIEHTWGRKLPAHVALIYFTTAVDSLAMAGLTFQYPVIVLARASSSYPPQNLMFEAINYISSQLRDHYGFFVRLDSDNFVNIPALVALIGQLDPNQLLYIGAPGRGRKDMQKKIGLTEEFCLGGSGVIMSRAVVVQLAGRIDECRHNITTPHEDVELARCIWRTSRTACRHPILQSADLRKLFYNMYFEVQTVHGALAAPGLPVQIPSVALDAIVVHPVRKAADFLKLRHLHSAGLRPLQNVEAPYTNEKHIYRSACVHSWTSQVLLMCGETLAGLRGCKWKLMRECSTPSPSYPELAVLVDEWAKNVAVVVHPPVPILSNNSAYCLADEIRRHVVSPRSIILLGPRKDAAVLLVRDAIRKAMHDKADYALVIEGGGRVHKHFAGELERLLAEPRCGGHLYTEMGGVLVLSSQEPVPSLVAKLIATDQARHASLCYNMPFNRSSAQAAIYHRNVFPTVVKYVDNPFDQLHLTHAGLLTRLIMEGFVVRAANVPLVWYPRAEDTAAAPNAQPAGHNETMPFGNELANSTSANVTDSNSTLSNSTIVNSSTFETTLPGVIETTPVPDTSNYVCNCGAPC